MEPEIVSAIIALGGVILSVLVSFLFNFFQTRYNYNQLFAQTVSKNRMEWINVWRENISKFLACAEVLIKNRCECKACECDNCKILNYKKEFYETRGMIVSRLNMSEDLHVLIFAAINQIDYEMTNSDFIVKREYVLELARKILKPEWERVKNEARGKRK